MRHELFHGIYFSPCKNGGFALFISNLDDRAGVIIYCADANTLKSEISLESAKRVDAQIEREQRLTVG